MYTVIQMEAVLPCLQIKQTTNLCHQADAGDYRGFNVSVPMFLLSRWLLFAMSGIGMRFQIIILHREKYIV